MLASLLTTSKLPASNYVKNFLEHASPSTVIVVGILREHWSANIAFGFFTCYALSRDHIAATEKRLKRSLAYERLYESSYDI